MENKTKEETDGFNHLKAMKYSLYHTYKIKYSKNYEQNNNGKKIY